MELPLEYSSKELTYIVKLLYGTGSVYVPDIDEYFYLNIMKINCDNLAVEAFVERYNNREIPCEYEYEDYINNEDLQATVQGMGMDPDSFYLLVIFCFDFAYTSCIKGHEFIHPLMEIEKLIKIIPDNKHSEMKMTIETEKGKFIPRNSTTIWHILNSLKTEYAEFISNEKKSYPIDNEKWGEIFYDVKASKSREIWYFISCLNEFFKLNPQFKGRRKKGNSVSYDKKFLITRLIYYTGMSNNKHLLKEEYKDILNGFLKDFKNMEIKNFSSVYF